MFCFPAYLLFQWRNGILLNEQTQMYKLVFDQHFIINYMLTGLLNSYGLEHYVTLQISTSGFQSNKLFFTSISLRLFQEFLLDLGKIKKFSIGKISKVHLTIPAGICNVRTK